MRKVLFVLLAVTTLVASSCSKENKINRRIDGDWKATTFEGEVLAADESAVYSFSKDKKGNGSGTLTVTDPDFSLTLPFTYTIVEDKMTVVYNFLGDTETEVITINTYEKKKIVWTDAYNDQTILEPK